MSKSIGLALATELLKHQTFDAAIVVLEQARVLFPQSVRVQGSPGTDLLFCRSLTGLHPYPTRGHETGYNRCSRDPVPGRDNPPGLGRARSRRGHSDLRICRRHPASEIADALCGGVLLRVAEDNADFPAGRRFCADCGRPFGCTQRSRRCVSAWKSTGMVSTMAGGADANGKMRSPGS